MTSKTSIGLFDAAFKKKEEAARLWKEKNDLKFNDSFPASPTPSSSLPQTVDHFAETKSNFEPPNQPKPLSPLHEYKDIAILESIKVAPSKHDLITPIPTTTTTPIPTLQSHEIPELSSTKESDLVMTSEGEKESDVTPSNTSSLAPQTFTQSLESLTTGEKAMVATCVIALLYLHLSFHSLQEVLSYDYLALLCRTSKQLPSPSLDLSPLWRRFEEVLRRLSVVDVIVIPLLLIQLVVFFDWAPDVTDAALFSCTRLIADQVSRWRTSLTTLAVETRSDVARLYEQYQQKTPRVFRILLALSLASFVLRYLLLQMISALTWFFWTVVFPWRWYGLAGLAVVSAFCLTHLYLSKQQSRKEVVARLSQHVKALLEQKEEQQVAVDYLYYEILDHVVKRDVATPSQTSLSPRQWWSVFSSERREEDKEVAGDVSGKDVNDGLSLGGYALSSLWNEVQKEVGKDRRVRTFLMFIDGAQRKCWKIMTTTTIPTTSTVSAQPLSITPIVL